MSNMAIDQVLAQIRSMSTQAGAGIKPVAAAGLDAPGSAGAVKGPAFGDLLKQGIESVNRSQQSAKAATARERSDVKLALQIGAAKRFSKQIKRNSLWYRDEALKGQIAEFLNSKFGDREVVRAAYPKRITGKWVANSKNWKPIEAAAKGGK